MELGQQLENGEAPLASQCAPPQVLHSGGQQAPPSSRPRAQMGSGAFRETEPAEMKGRSRERSRRGKMVEDTICFVPVAMRQGKDGFTEFEGGKGIFVPSPFLYAGEMKEMVAKIWAGVGAALGVYKAEYHR